MKPNSALRVIIALTILVPSLMGPPAAAQEMSKIRLERFEARLEDARWVYQKLLNAPDGGIPERILKDTSCVAIVPGVLKAAFLVGGEFGKGVLSCKNEAGQWSIPAFIELGAGSFGWQIGAESTDLVLFFMGQQSKNVLLTSKLTIGADIGISAGPVGRSAEGSLGPRLSGIYSYAHSQGIFAGLAVKGAVLSPDAEANRAYYGRADGLQFILNRESAGPLPPKAEALVAMLP